jgi:arylformamidase
MGPAPGSGMRRVGIDSRSVEKFGSGDVAVNRALLRTGVVIVEGLDLSAVSAGWYDMAGLPRRLEGAGGAHARVMPRSAS